MIEFGALLLLGHNAYCDTKKRQISLVSIGVFVVLGIIIRLLQGGFEWKALVFSMIPGVLLLIISFFGKQSIGMGDGILLIGVGIVVEVAWLYKALFWAFLISGGYALYLLWIKKKSGKTEFPWVPFLFIGALIHEVEIWIG